MGRKLTRAQTGRIRAQQARRITRAAADPAEEIRGDEIQGTVVARHGKEALVEADSDGKEPSRVRCRIRANLEGLVAGDRVVFQPPAGVECNDTGVIVANLPRRNELLRPDNYGKLKAVAANIDRVLVVFAPLPAPSSLLLDRYLAACSACHLPAALLLNKADLVTAANHEEEEEEAVRLLALYESIGYEVLRCSARSGEGMARLRAFLGRGTEVLVGQSGVGKSSLLNALLPAAARPTGELSERSGLGQHTTSSAGLFHLSDGGALIDSPGVREFNLWHVDENILEDAFGEFVPFRNQCRFRDCRHLREPDCALRAAAERGEIAAERLRNFLRIRDSLAERPDRPR